MLSSNLFKFFHCEVYRPLLIVLLFTIIFKGEMTAQVSYHKADRGLILKFYPTFLITGEPYFGLCKNFGVSRIELGASYIYPSKSWLKYVNYSPYRMNNSFPDYSSFYSSTGYGLRGQFMFRIFNTFNAFIAIRFAYKHVEKDRTWVHYSWYKDSRYPASFSICISDKTEVKQAQILFLKQFFREKRFYMDFYVGMGVKQFVNYDIVHYGSTHFIFKEDPDYPFFSSPIRKSDGEIWQATINAGISVGINFFKKSQAEK